MSFGALAFIKQIFKSILMMIQRPCNVQQRKHIKLFYNKVMEKVAFYPSLILKLDFFLTRILLFTYIIIYLEGTSFNQ